jgi:DNA-binding response OmpR family regulator
MELLRVLLVEDEPVVRMMIETRLRAAGYPVTSVSSAEAALAQLAEGRFALLLTDLHLAAMDGLALMLKARAIDPELELIAFTAFATVEIVIKAFQCGARHFLCKPVPPGELEQHVAHAIDRQREQREQRFLLQQIRQVSHTVAEPRAPAYSTARYEHRHSVGPLRIDAERRQVQLFGTSLSLSQSEFLLLSYFARHPNAVLSHEQLTHEALNLRCDPREASELLKSYIHRLRARLATVQGGERLIVSKRGAGYLLQIAEA